MADPICFAVADALDGLFRLERRSPTLRGSVPLRVAQACVPLLQGNAFGWQLVLPQKWSLRRGSLGYTLDLDDDTLAGLRQRYQQGLRRALSAGWLRDGGPWHRFLTEQALFLAPPRRLGRKPVLTLWTGLLVRPERGLGLRLLAVGNRRSHSWLLSETLYAATESATESATASPGDPGLIPLCLSLSLSPAAQGSARVPLGGELACLAVMPEYREMGYGDQLRSHVEARARKLKLKRLFVLTTRTAHWFIERGFSESGIDALPKARRELYNLQRRSKVFVKPL